MRIPSGPKPSERRAHYRAVVEDLARRHAGQIDPGTAVRGSDET